MIQNEIENCDAKIGIRKISMKESKDEKEKCERQRGKKTYIA